MIKKFIIVLVGLVITSTSLSQTVDELKALALAQAKITADATVNQDFNTVLDYTLPSVLDLMGGKEAAVKGVEQAMAEMKQQGIVILTSEIVKMVGFAFEEGEYRCVIETHIVVQTGPDSGIDSQSYIFGIYNEAAGKWYFIEGGEFKTPALIQQVLPNFKTELVIPDDVRSPMKQ